MIFGKKLKVHRCPHCGKTWNEKDLDRKGAIARSLVFNPGLNPFKNLLPENDPGEWCSPCLREYMNLDELGKEILPKRLRRF